MILRCSKAVIVGMVARIRASGTGWPFPVHPFAWSSTDLFRFFCEGLVEPVLLRLLTAAATKGCLVPPPPTLARRRILGMNPCEQRAAAGIACSPRPPFPRAADVNATLFDQPNGVCVQYNGGTAPGRSNGATTMERAR